MRCALFVVLALISPAIVEILTRKAFVVHQTGAIVITGASTGIGRHAAVALAKQGYTVFAGVRKESDRESLIAEAQTSRMQPVIMDVADQKSLDAAAAIVKKHLAVENSQLVALVNNAGVGGSAYPVELAPQDALKTMYDINVFGVYRASATFVPLLRNVKGSRIVNIGSVGGAVRANPGNSIYIGTKWALEAISDSMRMELTPWDISVSLVEPAFVRTEIGNKESKDIYTRLPPQQYQLYRSHFDNFVSTTGEFLKTAEGPEVTTAAITHAITNTYPKTRYVVSSVGGVPAWFLVRLTNWLPDRLSDLVIEATSPK